MSLREPFEQRDRLAAVALLLCCIAGLLVWYGMLPAYNLATNDYPDEDSVGPDPEAYVGDRVVLEGEVVATDPVVIDAGHPQGSRRFTLTDAGGTLRNTEGSIDVGDRVRAFGTLTDTTTLAVDRSIARAPWEAQYMYLVSFLGGCWVLGRFVRGWRFDRARLAFVPRETPLALQQSDQVDATPAASESDPSPDEPSPMRSESMRGER